MPTYQYACTECDAQMEVVQSFSDDSLTVCPECEGRLRKVYSAVGVVFKGSGFYRTDSNKSANSSTLSGSDSGESSDSSGSESVGSSTSSTADSATSSGSESGGASESSGSSSAANGKDKSTPSGASTASG